MFLHQVLSLFLHWSVQLVAKSSDFLIGLGKGEAVNGRGGGVYGTLGVGGSVTGQSTTGYCLYSASKLVLVRCKCSPQ